MRDLWLCLGRADVASGVVYGAQQAVNPLLLSDLGHVAADYVERLVVEQLRRAAPGVEPVVWWELAQHVDWSLPASDDAEEGPSGSGPHEFVPARPGWHSPRCKVCREFEDAPAHGTTAPRSGVGEGAG